MIKKAGPAIILMLIARYRGDTPENTRRGGRNRVHGFFPSSNSPRDEFDRFSGTSQRPSARCDDSGAKGSNGDPAGNSGKPVCRSARLYSDFFTASSTPRDSWMMYASSDLFPRRRYIATRLLCVAEDCVSVFRRPRVTGDRKLTNLNRQLLQ